MRFARAHRGVVFYIALCALVVVALYVQSRRIYSATAQRRATAASNYTMCVGSRPILRKFQRFVVGVQELNRVLLENARATHAATPRSSSVYASQIDNIARLRDSTLHVSGVSIPVPTLKQCADRRAATLVGK